MAVEGYTGLYTKALRLMWYLRRTCSCSPGKGLPITNVSFKHNLKHAQTFPSVSPAFHEFPSHSLKSVWAQKPEQEPPSSTACIRLSRETILRHLVNESHYFYCSAYTIINRGVMASLPQEPAQPEVPALPAGRVRHCFHGEASSCTPLFALAAGAPSRGEPALSHPSGTLRAARAVGCAGPGAGETVPAQSLSPQEHSAHPQRFPCLTASDGRAVLTPGALLCGTDPCGPWWPWACLPPSPSPRPP